METFTERKRTTREEGVERPGFALALRCSTVIKQIDDFSRTLTKLFVTASASQKAQFSGIEFQEFRLPPNQLGA